MNILAFESSCDETAVAVVRDGRTVLSDAILSQADMHALYGGVVPEIASRKHVEAISGLTDRALSDAGLTKKDIDAVAVTYAPGLIGAVLVAEFQWMLVLFGLFLMVTGVKMLFSDDTPPSLEANRGYQWLRRHLRLTPGLHGKHFLVRGETQQLAPGWWATPLLLTLILIESADVVFAVDSIPAIFSITQDPFLVYTSNIFAILGLRALYFALAAMVHRFHYLKYALALVLVFIGVKVGLVYLHDIHVVDFTIPTPLSLGVTLLLLSSGVAVSLYKTRHEPIG